MKVIEKLVKMMFLDEGMVKVAKILTFKMMIWQ